MIRALPLLLASGAVYGLGKLAQKAYKHAQDLPAWPATQTAPKSDWTVSRDGVTQRTGESKDESIHASVKASDKAAPKEGARDKRGAESSEPPIRAIY